VEMIASSMIFNVYYAPLSVITVLWSLKIGGSLELGNSMCYKALHHCKHLGLDLSLGFHFYCQFTELLLRKVCPSYGTERYVKLPD
jgi:hypothetical protein